MAMFIHCLVIVIILAPGLLYLANESHQLPVALDIAHEGSLLSKIYFPWMLPLLGFYYLLTRIPMISACVRRLHTLPRSGWWVLIGLIPTIGWFILLIWMLQKGTYEDLQKRIRLLNLGGIVISVPDVLKERMKELEKPRQGGWFFAVFALLAVLGFFLNRQVMKAGTQAEIRSMVREGNFSEIFHASAQPEDDVSEIVAEPIPTATAISQVDYTNPMVEDGQDSEENEPGEILPVRAGVPVTAKKDGSTLLLTENGILASVSAVSVGQYQQCVSAGVCEMPDELFALAYQNMEDEAGELPMIWVTSAEASSYCTWAGMRLPTADEWRTAAKSETPGTNTASNCIGTDRSGLIPAHNQSVLTVPVNSFADFASDYGMIQMFGNVWEWVDTGNADQHMALGGAWNSYPETLLAEFELNALEHYAADNIGFRCFLDESAVTDNLFEAEIQEPDPAELPEPTAISNDDDTASGLPDPGDMPSPDIEPVSGGKKDDKPAPAETEEAEITETGDVRAKDSAKMAAIPASVFNMGVNGGAVDEKPVHEVSLSAYYIDIYEVTNGQYALCVTDGACTEPHSLSSFRHNDYYGNSQFDDYPVIYVDWDQAAAYCEWAGGRLPTEAEWEFAAKGPEGLPYPWGRDFISTNLNYSGNGDYDTRQVGSMSNDVSPFGLYDMGGNVSEWVFDRYQENWYTVTDQPTDPTGPASGNYRVIRGGSSQTSENNARTGDRFYAMASSFNLDRGFRCVVPAADQD